MQAFVDYNIAKIDELIEHTEYKLSEFLRKDLTQVDLKIVTNFEGKPIKGLLDMYATDLNFDSVNIKKAIYEMITIQIEPGEELKIKNPGIDSSSSIFYPVTGTKELVHYDLNLKSVRKYDLSNHITNNFEYSSSCILPDGNILIAGGHSPNGVYLGDTYKIDVSKNPVQTTKLGDLNTPRYAAKLIYYDGYIYIFGGYDRNSIKKAERMQLYGSNWTTLPDMIEARSAMGVCAEGSRIYIIGGYENTSIEYYDIQLNTFTLLPSIEVPSDCVVAGVIEDRLYVIGKDRLSVFSKDFQLIESVGHMDICNPFSFSNIIVQGTKLSYVNYQNSSLYMLDATTKTITT